MNETNQIASQIQNLSNVLRAIEAEIKQQREHMSKIRATLWTIRLCFILIVILLLPVAYIAVYAAIM